MNRISIRKSLRGLPWLMYLAAALAAAGLKVHYSRATVDDLAWVLEPTATVVGWLLCEPLRRNPHVGWVAAGGSFIIAPACAGVNFLILVLSVSVLGFAHRFRGARQCCGWLLLTVCAAYVLTIAVNSLRILIAVHLYRAEMHAGWLTPERVHRLAGAMVYLVGLWAAWLGFDYLSARARQDGASAGWAPTVVLPAAYIGMTVVVPLLNGAWRDFGMRYLEHALTVSLLAAATLPLLSLIRWATSGAIVPGPRSGGDGQTHSLGGRGRTGDC
jgi:exosortase K